MTLPNRALKSDADYSKRLSEITCSIAKEQKGAAELEENAARLKANEPSEAQKGIMASGRIAPNALLMSYEGGLKRIAARLKELEDKQTELELEFKAKHIVVSAS